MAACRGGGDNEWLVCVGISGRAGCPPWWYGPPSEAASIYGAGATEVAEPTAIVEAAVMVGKPAVEAATGQDAPAMP